MEVLRIDHIQLAMPKGREEEARRFYHDLLGIPEMPKPPQLAARGVWFERGDLKARLGVDKQFVPARKAHPGFLVADLPALIAKLRGAGIVVNIDEPLESCRRVYVDDPFGNRLKFLEPVPA